MGYGRELVDLRWDQIEFVSGTLHVRRVKQGTPSTHPILGDELRASRRLTREQEPRSPFVFTSERGAPFSTAGFARMVERAGVEAKLAFKARPHMLRHACGYALANRGHDTRALQAYLGHRTYSTPYGILSCRRRDLRTSGGSRSLSGVKRTSPDALQMSAFDPKPTLDLSPTRFRNWSALQSEVALTRTKQTCISARKKRQSLSILEI